MLLVLLEWVASTSITLRAALAALCSFAAALALGPWLIAWLNARFREPNVSPSPRLRQLHAHKQWTPTMGGLFVVAGLAGAILLLGDLRNPYLPIGLFTLIGLACVGAVDDLLKLSRHRRGLSAQWKLAGQTTTAAIAAIWLYQVQATQGAGLQFWMPLAGSSGSLGQWFIPLAALVIVASSNAVNLTDGLDGLAGGCLIATALALTVAAYSSGHADLAVYLGIPHLPAAGELTVVAAGLVGAVLGFLWFNCYPAQVFMGDTGSLSLGGLLGLLAIAIRQEVLLVVAGGVFVIEAVSVLVQLGARRWLGRRVLQCAPLHHHFQFVGWSESKIVVRFWIASALCAALGLAGLKSNIQSVQHESPPHGTRPQLALTPNP